jgi:hypothetical protein
MDSKTYWTWDDDVKRWIPNRHYLKFDPDLSAFWDWHLALHGKGPVSVLAGDARYTVVGELGIGELREQGFPVTHSPNDLSEIGCAHSSVDWPSPLIPPGMDESDKNRRKALQNRQKALQTQVAREFSWVIGGPPSAPPNGA